MKLRDFRIGWRLLLREPAYSCAVVLGLAVAFAACFLLLGLVRYCYTYNAAIAGGDRIYAVKERRNALPRPDWDATAPAPLVAVARRSGLEVEATSARSFELTARVDNRFVPLPPAVADAGFLDFFGVRALEGDARAALARPDALVLARSMAIKLFGQAHALGRLLYIDGAPFVVRAILPDMPANTSVGFDALVGVGAHSWDPPSQRAGAEWFNRTAGYIKAAPGVNPQALHGMLQETVSRERDAPMAARFQLPGGQRLTDIAIVPLSKIYFDPDLLAGRAGARYGSKFAVGGLAALALLILALAAANYVNLAAVRTIGRQREIGVRKALGVSGARLAWQFIAESLVVALLATVAGLLVASLARPLGGMFSPAVCAAMLATGALVGILSGLYPAWLALRLQASITLQNGGAIGRLLGREFARLVALGALVGVPLGWLGIERYLAGFVERAPMGQSPLAGALALVGLVALAATWRQGRAAVRMSPALALRE
jgi:hypothetical protein